MWSEACPDANAHVRILAVHMVNHAAVVAEILVEEVHGVP